MAFTKITAAGIGSTETVTLDGVAVINNESIGGNLTVTGNATIGGVLTYEDVTNVDSVGLITARNGVVVGSGITLSKDGDGFFTGVVTATSYAGDGSGLTGIAATDNVRTGILDVAGVGTFRNDVNIPDKIIHLGDTDTAIRFPAADTVSVETGGSERVRIDSSGRMGIGDNSPDRELVVKHASSNSTIKIESANTHTSQLMFADSDGEQVGRVAVFHGSGQVTSNSLTLDTAGTARVRIEPAGNVNVAQNLKVAGVCTATSFNGSLAASNLTGALPAIDGSNLTGLGGGVPTGCILIWSGASNAIPTGYVLCDGNNSTPDLRDRFVIGAGNNYAVDATGGAATDTVTSTGNYYGATRTGSTGVSGAELVSIATQNYVYNHSVNRFAVSTGYNRLISTLTLNNISVSGTVDTLPPYYALCYIMKT